MSSNLYRQTNRGKEKWRKRGEADWDGIRERERERVKKNIVDVKKKFPIVSALLTLASAPKLKAVHISERLVHKPLLVSSSTGTTLYSLLFFWITLKVPWLSFLYLPATSAAKRPHVEEVRKMENITKTENILSFWRWNFFNESKLCRGRTRTNRRNKERDKHIVQTEIKK